MALEKGLYFWKSLKGPTHFTLQKYGVACTFEEIRHVLIMQWLFILYTLNKSMIWAIYAMKIVAFLHQGNLVHIYIYIYIYIFK
jgi:hypothetical protein